MVCNNIIATILCSSNQHIFDYNEVKTKGISITNMQPAFGAITN